MIMEISTNGIVYIIEDTSYNIFLYYTPNIVKYYILFRVLFINPNKNVFTIRYGNFVQFKSFFIL